MKIVFKQTIAGNHFLYKKGKEYEVNNIDAARFVKIGFAKKVETKETATAKTKRTTRKKSSK